MGEIISLVIDKSLEQLYISMSAFIVCTVMGILAGAILSRYQKLYKPIMSIVSVFQTIPSLALLALMVPIFGIGKKPAIIALTIYCVLPVLQNTYTGLNNVSPTVLDAATGMGFSDAQLLIKVKLPLSIKMIMAGIRMAAVYSISWASLASSIGAGGLGDLIFNGLNLFNYKLVLAGTVPMVFLALILDTTLSVLEKKVTPKHM